MFEDAKKISRCLNYVLLIFLANEIDEVVGEIRRHKAATENVQQPEIPKAYVPSPSLSTSQSYATLLAGRRQKNDTETVRLTVYFCDFFLFITTVSFIKCIFIVSFII